MNISFDFPLDIMAIKFVAIMMRIGAFTAAFSFFDNANIPATYKTLFVIMLSVCMVPLVPASWANAAFVQDLDMFKLGLLLASEAILGIGIGLVVSFVLEVFNYGGSVIDMDIGFNAAQEFDPASQDTRSVIAGFFSQAFVVLFLAEDCHHEVIKLAFSSFETLGPGAFLMSSDIFESVVKMSSAIFTSGIQIALPTLGAMLIINIALGLLARIGEDFPVLMISFPLKLAVGIVIIIAIFPTVTGFFRVLNGELIRWIGMFTGVYA